MTLADAAEADTDGDERIARNFARYERHLERARGFLARREHAAAAAHCAVASHIAVQNHAGIFWSPRLEKILNEIGRALVPDGSPPPRPREPRRILQVMTQAEPVGGLTKMLCQWVQADRDRRHTLVFTQHRGPVPGIVQDAFGSRVHHLNHRPGGLLTWAAHLRRLALGHDLVVLHTHCEDVVPLIAFARPEMQAPVLVLNHADHLLWLGPGVCHLCINLRDAAQELAVTRRGIAPERNILMPTLAEAVRRTRSRDEAKRELGIEPDTILMVSVARRPKYKTLNGVTFADIHAPVLEKHPRTMLYVVGVGDPEDWDPVRARLPGRIRTTPQTPDPRVYFEAADIYVDSYPFVSSTSMMEAAGYGAPGVTIFTYPEEARIFGINHVALVGNVMQAASLDEYRDMLDRLIRDPALRERVAAKASASVAREHNMPGWSRWLEAVYARAMERPILDNRAMLEEVEVPSFGEPDWRHEDIFGSHLPEVQFVKGYMGMLPLRQHLAHWDEVRRQGGYDGPFNAGSHLAPEWLKRVIKDRILRLS